MKWQVAQEGQVDARGAAHVVVDRVSVLIHGIGEFEQSERHVRLDRHIKLGLAEGGNHKGTVADAARDSLSADVEFDIQAPDGQRAVVGVLHIELDREILLQQVAAEHFYFYDRYSWPVEFGSHQGTGGQAQRQSGGRPPPPHQHSFWLRCNTPAKYN